MIVCQCNLKGKTKMQESHEPLRTLKFADNGMLDYLRQDVQCYDTKTILWLHNETSHTLQKHTDHRKKYHYCCVRGDLVLMIKDFESNLTTRNNFKI